MVWVFRSICWLLAVYFFLSVHAISGFPIKVDQSTLLPLLISIFLLLLPFSKSLSIGHMFKYEAHFERLKDDIHDFKTEVRTLVNVQNSAFSAVENRLSQNTTVNIPPISEAYNAERKIEENASPAGSSKDNDFSEFISEGLSDPNLALAKLRMELEQEFRKILGKRIHLGDKVDMKFMSLRALWREFFRSYPNKRYLTDGLQYVNDIANAAIHGQMVPREHAEEALGIGIRLLNEIRSVEAKEVFAEVG